MQKVSKAKSDVPATNHSDKVVAEPPKGKPDVDSQSKNDAKVQTNKLVVEKKEKGASCLSVVFKWLITGPSLKNLSEKCSSFYIWVKSLI